MMVFILIGCNQSQVKTKNIWSPEITKLKGNVKTVKVSVYEAIDESGTVTKGRLNHTLISKYDRSGNKTETLRFDTGGGLTEMYRYKYDSYNNLIEPSSFNSAGNQIQKDTYRYDENRYLIENEKHNHFLNQHTTSYCEYDKKGREKKVIRCDSDGEIQATRTFSYDSQGNKSQTFEDIEYGYRSSSKYVYDANANEIESFDYDSEGRIKTRHATAYDHNNNIIKRVSYNSDGSVHRSNGYAYRYDRKGNWIRKTEYQNNIPEAIRIREIEYYE